MEQRLKSLHPIVLAIGSGRSLRAAVEQLEPMVCPHHKIVSLVGNIGPDGSASFYDVIVRIADAVQAPHYPLPLPVIASTSREQRLFFEQPSVRQIVSLAQSADVTYVGIGDLGAEPSPPAGRLHHAHGAAGAGARRRGRRDRRLGLRRRRQPHRGPHQRPRRQRQAGTPGPPPHRSASAWARQKSAPSPPR